MDLQETFQHLTDDQAATINAAIDIIKSVTGLKASWQFSVSHYDRDEYSTYVTFFTMANTQLSCTSGHLGHGTVASQIDAGLAHDAKEQAGIIDVRAARAQKLREELARLEGEAA